MRFNITLGAALHGETAVVKTKVGGRRHGTTTATATSRLGGRCRHSAYETRLGMDFSFMRDPAPTVVRASTCLCVLDGWVGVGRKGELGSIDSAAAGWGDLI